MSEKDKSIKLLLIDDGDDFRQAASKALTRRGFIITEAANGQEGLNRLTGDTPDIVLLDLKMRGLAALKP